MPSWASIDGPAFEPLRSQSILFELVRQPFDFRYAEIGSRMQDISNGDYTGRLLSDLPHQRPPSKVWDHLSGAFDARAPVKGCCPMSAAAATSAPSSILSCRWPPTAGRSTTCSPAST